MLNYLSQDGQVRHIVWRMLEEETFDEIHFFENKTFKGGNCYEIYNNERTIDHQANTLDGARNRLSGHFGI